MVFPRKIAMFVLVKYQIEQNLKLLVMYYVISPTIAKDTTNKAQEAHAPRFDLWHRRTLHNERRRLHHLRNWGDEIRAHWYMLLQNEGYKFREAEPYRVMG